MLARNGLSNDVTLVSTGGQAAGLTILRQQGIDATVASDPAITIAGDKLDLISGQRLPEGSGLVDRRHDRGLREIEP